MEKFKYQKIDAFTSNQSTGNPATCIFLTETQTLSETAMQDIARQHKGFVSEVIYCRCHEGIFLTYYSSECEVNFCGHGTIACMYSLIRTTEKLLQCKEIPIHTNKKGALTVYNQIKEQDAVFISAPKPTYLTTLLNPCDIMEPLDLSKEDISNEFTMDFIDAGLRTLIVPVSSTEKIVNIFP
ncbi:MAG: PhzF family phenazine biosynthesis protein, partial [Eubacteriales bacterium]|nr:PhzF family phenazine biosynthesis protein [Eubacteriales bacterium]